LSALSETCRFFPVVTVVAGGSITALLLPAERQGEGLALGGIATGLPAPLRATRRDRRSSAALSPSWSPPLLLALGVVDVAAVLDRDDLDGAGVIVDQVDHPVIGALGLAGGREWRVECCPNSVGAFPQRPVDELESCCRDLLG
jgi:hypothetical protein